MNINLKFENVVWSKKIGYVILAIAICVFFGIAAIVIGVLTKHYDTQLVNAKDQARLVSITMEEDIENITDSLLFISNLISDEEMKRNISPAQVTNLLNELISKDDKIFGAFVMLDKSEFSDIEELADEIDFASSDVEADEAIGLLEANDKLDDDDEKRKYTSSEDTILDGVNKFVYKSNGSTFETNLDRLKTLDYKKSYMKVMLTKTPQMTKPLKNTYNGVEVLTCTYQVPIVVDGSFEGVIGIDIDVEKLRQDIQAKAEGLSSEFIICDKQGSIVAATNDSLTNSVLSELFKGNSNKKTLEYINDNIESGFMSSFNAGSSDMLHDKYLVMIPVNIEDNHMWNIIFIAYVDKVITNSIATILLVSIINIVLFGLFILLMWLSFGAIMNKKYNSLFYKVETELTKIKANSQRIMEDIEDIEEIEIEDIEEEEELNPDEEVQKALREKDAQLEREEEERIAQENMDQVEPELEKENSQSAIVNEDDPSLAFGAPTEPEKTEENPQSAIVNEDDPSLAFGAPSEEAKEAPVEEEIDNGFDAEAFAQARKETDEKLAAAEAENAQEEAKTEEVKEPEREVTKIDLDNPVEKMDGSKLSAMDQLASASADPEGLDEILANKGGNIDDNAFVDEMAAKMEAAMAKGDDEDEPKAEEPKVEEPKVEEPKVEEPKVEEPKVEEPKVEEPKVEEPKIEEPKIEEPKIEEPKIEEPKPEPAPAPAPEEDEAAKAAKLKELQAKVAAKMKKETEPYTVRVSHDDPDDLFGGAHQDRKLTNKEMDDLLKELEDKRRYEAEEMGMVAEEINVEDQSLSELLGGMTSDDM